MRFTIARLMMLVVAAAANFVVLRSVSNINSGLNPLPELLVIGGLPMLNLLILAHSIRRPGRPFLDGFIAAGWVSLVSFVAIATAFPGPLFDAARKVMGSIFGAGPFGLAMIPAFFLCYFAIYSAPQLFIAAIAGWLRRGYRIQLLIERRPESRPTTAA